MRIQYLGLASKKNCKFLRVVIHDKMTFTTKNANYISFFLFFLLEQVINSCGKHRIPKYLSIYILKS